MTSSAPRSRACSMARSARLRLSERSGEQCCWARAMRTAAPPGKSRTLENRPFLDRLLGGQAERSLDRLPVADPRRNVLSQRRPVFAAMARAAAHQPHVGQLGVPIDKEVAVRRVLVLAHLGRYDRRVPEPWEPTADELADARPRLGARDARERVRIHGWAMLVGGDLETAAPEVRYAVDLFREVHPNGQGRGMEAVVACRHPEVEDLLPRREDPLAEEITKQLGEPGAAREHERLGGDGLAGAGRHSG